MWTMRSLTTFRAATGRLAQPIAQSRALSTMNTLRAASVPRARLAAPATNALHTLLRSPSPACLAAPHLRASRALRTRFMSTTPPPQGSPATVTFFKQTASWVVQNKTVVMVVAGMSVVMYGFYRGSVRLMKFFFNVSDKQIFTLGFAGGILAALIIGGSAAYAQRRLTFQVDDVYRAALRQLRKHEVVEQKLGDLWRPGGFRGYAVESMREAAAGSERRARTSYFEAPSRRIQMIFMLRGHARDGMVSLEAYKRGGSYHFDMLSLDLKAYPAAGLKPEHIFLSGDSDHVLFDEIADVLDATRASGRPSKTMEEASMEG